MSGRDAPAPHPLVDLLRIRLAQRDRARALAPRADLALAVEDLRTGEDEIHTAADEPRLREDAVAVRRAEERHREVDRCRACVGPRQPADRADNEVEEPGEHDTVDGLRPMPPRCTGSTG